MRPGNVKDRDVLAFTMKDVLDPKWADLNGHQDDCLIAIAYGHPLPVRHLQALPPWRAVLMARVAERAGVQMEHGTLPQLIAEARAVTGDGTLGNWWERKE